MQKNKDNLVDDLFNKSDQIDDDFDDIEDEMFYDEQEDAVTTMFPVIMNSTIEITKLIIENRVRNSEKLTDSEIYKIHTDAFQHISNIFVEK